MGKILLKALILVIFASIRSMTKAKEVSVFSWTLGSVVVLAAVIVWVGGIRGPFHLNSYILFPLFGLLAFSLMWTHYIIGATRRYVGVPKQAVERYFKITGGIVLASILLHPTLLIYQLWRDGFGLPPKSYLENYVAPGGKIAVLLGSMSFVIFLSFELKKKFGKKTWWKLVDYAQVVAMVAIFYHALTLGGALSVDWFRALWFFYGVSFVIAVSYSYVFNTSKEETKV